MAKLKHSWSVTGPLLGAWAVLIFMIIVLHWRIARILMPIVSVILLIYLISCSIVYLWTEFLKPKKPSTDPVMGQGSANKGSEKEE